MVIPVDVCMRGRVQKEGEERMGGGTHSIQSYLLKCYHLKQAHRLPGVTAPTDNLLDAMTIDFMCLFLLIVAQPAVVNLTTTR